MSYEKDHVVFDALGLLSVHCYACNTIVRKRVAVPVKDQPERSVLVMMTLGNYRERETVLSDGSLMYVIYCADCNGIAMDGARVMAITINGWEKELQAAGRPKVAIDRMKQDKGKISIVKVNRTLTEFDRLDESVAKDEATQKAEAVKAEEKGDAGNIQ